MEGLGVLVENGRFQEKLQEKNSKSMRLPRKPVVWWQETLHLLEQMDVLATETEIK